MNGVVLWSAPDEASANSVQEYREWETSNADRAFEQMCEDQALVEKREEREMWKRRLCEDQALVEKFTQTTDEQNRLIKEAVDEQHMKDCLEVSSFP